MAVVCNAFSGRISLKVVNGAVINFLGLVERIIWNVSVNKKEFGYLVLENVRPGRVLD